MKNITNKIRILAAIACVLAMAPGCSHQAKPGADDGSAAFALLPRQEAEDQFIKDVANLPMDQRKDYVEAHTDALDQFKMDPDKSKMAQLDSLMPPEIP